jgi:MGT family glycosyltransferase
LGGSSQKRIKTGRANGMSKIFFITPPAQGHFNPALPVMQELVRRGERVICYNNEEYRPQIEKTGVEFRAYPTTILTAKAISDVLADGNLSRPHLLMMQATESLAPFTLNALAQEQCDLVIFDSLAIWGKIAATSLNLKAAATISHFVFDLPSMNLSFREYLTLMGQFFSQVRNLLRARRRLIKRFGKAYPLEQPLFPMRDQLNIVFTARELQPKASIIDDSFHFVGPSINPQTRSEDFPFEALKQKPMIYLSLGTVHTNTAFYRTCFKAFTEYPAQFVLAVGKDTNIAELGVIPANFIVRPFVPQLKVLQRADVFITHGGINSVHEGLYYGVPLLLIPHQFEQLLNARCVTARDAGLIIDDQIQHKPVTAEKLRLSLQEVLANPRYTENAKKIQKVLQETGGFQQAADAIQSYLAERHQASAH